MNNTIEILKKTGLFLLGVLMVIWGYRANVTEKQSKGSAQEEIDKQKNGSAQQTSTEGDGAEESSSSQ